MKAVVVFRPKHDVIAVNVGGLSLFGEPCFAGFSDTSCVCACFGDF